MQLVERLLLDGRDRRGGVDQKSLPFDMAKVRQQDAVKIVSLVQVSALDIRILTD